MRLHLLFLGLFSATPLLFLSAEPTKADSAPLTPTQQIFFDNLMNDMEIPSADYADQIITKYPIDNPFQRKPYFDACKKIIKTEYIQPKVIAYIHYQKDYFKPNGPWEQLAKRYFTPQEIEQIRAVDNSSVGKSLVRDTLTQWSVGSPISMDQAPTQFTPQQRKEMVAFAKSPVGKKLGAIYPGMEKEALKQIRAKADHLDIDIRDSINADLNAIAARAWQTAKQTTR